MTESPLPDHLARLPPANNIPPPDNSCLTLPSPLSAMEATYYYAGLDPPPILVARSSTTPWEPPSGPNAEWDFQELGPVRHKALSEAWEGGLPKEVIALLRSMDVKYTSVSAVRFKPVADDTIYAPVRVVVWIGVRPKSLCGDDGVVVVSKCKELLEKHNITDVEVEICELTVPPGEPKYFGGKPP
ncbi:hypothetical protein RSOL_057900, partial [Rhizoctonia solani AG-3 Rhs1AP]